MMFSLRGSERVNGFPKVAQHVSSKVENTGVLSLSSVPLSCPFSGFKANTEARLAESKVCFLLDAGNSVLGQGEEVDICLKAKLPH